MKNTFKFSKVLVLLGAALCFSCGGDDTPEMGDDPIASFQFTVSESDFLEVSFTNFSQNADSYVWDFGDGNMSTEESPTHKYENAAAYTVKLTATGNGTSIDRSETITITDPNAALKLLTGETSKTWKLFREGTAMSLGPDADNPAQYWAGLTNDGTRPCLYEQEFTFNANGSYVFNDNGVFWGEFGVFDGTSFFEECFTADAANMINKDGADVSAWLSGTHAWSYDPSSGDLTLTGEGAWIGIPKLATTGQLTIPQSSVSTAATIESFTGYDVMTVVFIYEGEYWPIKYASYSDASLEPVLVTDAEEFGMDLPNVTPTEITHSFATNEGFAIDTIVSGSTIDFGVEDPADSGAAAVGQFNRTGDRFQELQFQTSPEKLDIQFDNLNSVTLDVYLPSSNDYTGGLTQDVRIGFGDRSQTEMWWTDLTEYLVDGSGLALDTWHTVTVDINMPSYVANAENGATPKDRSTYDMMYIQIGGGDHEVAGTFYVRNLIAQ